MSKRMTQGDNRKENQQDNRVLCPTEEYLHSLLVQGVNGINFIQIMATMNHIEIKQLE